MTASGIERINDYPSVLVRNNDVEGALVELRNKIENIKMFKITRRRHKSSTIQQRLRKKRRMAVEFRKKESTHTRRESALPPSAAFRRTKTKIML